MTIDEHYTYPSPIRSVAVIGAGAASAPAARHLRDAGLAVRVFERQAKAGGIWNWSPELSHPLSVPTPAPSHGAFRPTAIPPAVAAGETVTIPAEWTRESRQAFSPANPVYSNLTNNVPTTTMAFKDFPYPPGTPENIPHTEISAYMNAYVERFEIDKLASYQTRVERVDRVVVGGAQKWRLHLHKYEASADGDGGERTFWTEDFDAVVTATGHYNAPYIPALPGADAWAAHWPDQVLHSSGYRRPETYAGKNVLIVGIGTSGVDIARDLAGHAAHVHMVGKAEIRGPEGYQKMRRMQRRIVPSGEALPEIRRFRAPAPGEPLEAATVELADGRTLTGLSLVLFATGYQYSYPFFPQFHRDPALGPPDDATKDALLITDGGGVLNLYRDVFYIRDPTLAFLGLSVNTSAFSFFEYQSISVARVFAGQARLPSLQGMQEAYSRLVDEKGEGKFGHFMGQANERAYVRDTVEWLNRDAQWSGAPIVEGHSKEWLEASDRIIAAIAAKYGLDPPATEALAEVDASKVVVNAEERDEPARMARPVIELVQRVAVA
ncbi:hypothetical protein Q5752_006109 [Cryptotrichosporon argae]